jgi:peptide/nickel transport system permease protein
MTRRDVTTDIVEFLPASLELIIFAAVVEVFFSITLGVLAGRRANTWVDNTIRVFSYLGVAVPSFVFGVIFLLTLGFIFPVFPRGGRLSTGLLAPGPVTGMLTIDSLLTGNLRVFADATWHLVLPGLALCLGGLAQDCRITRSSVVENMNKDYILSATSHGIPERIIMLKYLLKPSLIPAVSIMGLDIAGLLGNAFLVELIFGFPGFSRYGITAMMNKDLNAIVGTVMVIGLVFAVVNIAVDILVAYIDPRIRLTEKAK